MIVVRVSLSTFALALAMLFVGRLLSDPSRPPEGGDAGGVTQGFETCTDMSGCTNRISSGNSYRIDNLNVSCRRNALAVEVKFGEAVQVRCVNGELQGQTGVDWKGDLE